MTGQTIPIKTYQSSNQVSSTILRESHEFQENSRNVHIGKVPTFSFFSVLFSVLVSFSNPSETIACFVSFKGITHIHVLLPVVDYKKLTVKTRPPLKPSETIHFQKNRN